MQHNNNSLLNTEDYETMPTMKEHKSNVSVKLKDVWSLGSVKQTQHGLHTQTTLPLLP